MKGPYGLNSHESCKTCNLRGAGFFCQLSPGAMKEFEAIKSTATYPKGALLFLERQDSRGVFALCQGEVKLSIGSSEGKTLVVGIAKTGEVIGLMAAMAGSPYEVTAETLHPCQVAFIRRDDFLHFIAKHPETAASVAKQMSSQYQAACEQLRTVGLSASAQEKLGRLLLLWSSDAPETDEGARIKMPLTHEEIAEFIGTTRETVTRTLSEFRHRHLVALHGSTLMIPSRAALQTFVDA